MAKMAVESAAIDDIDREILKTLEFDGRATIVEVAKAVALSQNATADRIRRLVHAGVIAGFAAQISAEALGLRLEAYVDVKLRSECPADDFERRLEGVPGLLECVLTTGSFDYMLRIACRDQDDLVRVAEYLRTTAGAAETYSRIILRQRRFPMTSSFDSRRRAGR
jgi:Lrp/AsnC family transcriptional regulator, leucine-responsive regulatory protein